MHFTKLFISILSISMMLFSCIKDDEGNEEVINYIKVNDQIPTFAVADTTGNMFSSKQFLGKQSLLVFFGTFCPDCQQVLPTIETVWKKLKDDPQFILVPISREEQAEVVADYWEKHQFTMPFYLDSDRSVFNLFANNTIPRIYIINSKNIVTWMSVESLDLSADELIQKIKE